MTQFPTQSFAMCYISIFKLLIKSEKTEKRLHGLHIHQRSCVVYWEQNALHDHIYKFLQTIYFYKAEIARKIDAQLKFQYTGYFK